jgi:ATP-dependent Clp protease ATP-binding subunit ClpB
MTSNLGAAQMTDLMTGGMGFVRPSEPITNHLDEKLQRTAIDAARHKFSPEFINRLDKLVVFRPLRREQLEEVLQIELRKVQSRVSRATNRPFLFRISEEARQFLLDEGTDQRYGARHLNRAIERFLIHPLARLLATDQLRSGDRLLIDLHPARNCLAFARDAQHHVSYPGVAFGDADSLRRTRVEVQA